MPRRSRLVPAPRRSSCSSSGVRCRCSRVSSRDRREPGRLQETPPRRVGCASSRSPASGRDPPARLAVRLPRVVPASTPRPARAGSRSPAGTTTRSSPSTVPGPARSAPSSGPADRGAGHASPRAAIGSRGVASLVSDLASPGFSADAHPRDHASAANRTCSCLPEDDRGSRSTSRSATAPCTIARDDPTQRTDSSRPAALAAFDFSAHAPRTLSLCGRIGQCSSRLPISSQ